VGEGAGAILVEVDVVLGSGAVPVPVPGGSVVGGAVELLDAAVVGGVVELLDGVLGVPSATGVPVSWEMSGELVESFSWAPTHPVAASKLWGDIGVQVLPSYQYRTSPELAAQSVTTTEVNEDDVDTSTSR
jgi:hypothetical protein